MPPVSPYPNHPNIQMQAEYQNHQIQQQQQTRQQPQKFNHPVYGVNMNPIQRVAGISEQQQFGTTSQTSNNSNEESSGSEQRRKYVVKLMRGFSNNIRENMIIISGILI